MAKITLEQLQKRHTTHLEKELKKDDAPSNKHGLIRLVLKNGASNAMALAVVSTHTGGRPKVTMADVRWNRNQWKNENGGDYIDHAEADAKEQRSTGTMLDPCTETKKQQATAEKGQAAKAGGAKAGGAKAGGAKAGGAKAGGAKAGGAKAGGAKTGGAKASGAKASGAKAGGAKARDVDPADIEF